MIGIDALALQYIQSTKLNDSQHLCGDSVLLPAIERLTVEINDSSIASLRAAQLTLTTKLKPGNGHNGPGCVKKEKEGGGEREGEREREGDQSMFIPFSLNAGKYRPSE